MATRFLYPSTHLNSDHSERDIGRRVPGVGGGVGHDEPLAWRPAAGQRGPAALAAAQTQQLQRHARADARAEADGARQPVRLDLGGVAGIQCLL